VAASDVWDVASSDFTTAGSFGLYLDQQLTTLNDIASSDVQAELVTYAASTHAATDVAILILPETNVAFSNITFEMYDSTDHNPLTGLTVTGQRSIDGAAYAGVGGSIAEISNGTYQFDAAQADMNGAMIVFRFTATGADDTYVHIKTAP
jgi:hypothetical protein